MGKAVVRLFPCLCLLFLSFRVVKLPPVRGHRAPVIREHREPCVRKDTELCVREHMEPPIRGQ